MKVFETHSEKENKSSKLQKVLAKVKNCAKIAIAVQSINLITNQSVLFLYLFGRLSPLFCQFWLVPPPGSCQPRICCRPKDMPTQHHHSRKLPFKKSTPHQPRLPFKKSTLHHHQLLCNNSRLHQHQLPSKLQHHNLLKPLHKSSKWSANQ